MRGRLVGGWLSRSEDALMRVQSNGKDELNGMTSRTRISNSEL
jgi:hypothetical protein